jgi:Beta-propeller repeat/Abnormal spindle-like microcephaly-assoc'd, ASPM-SPD-2-Hydin
MKRNLFALCMVCLAALAIAPGRHKLPHSSKLAPLHTQPASPPASQADILWAYGKLPLNFETNQGQTDARVDFLAHGNGYTVFLTRENATLLLRAQSGENASPAKPVPSSISKSAKRIATSVRLALAGANPHTEVEALDAQLGKSNYLIGSNPSNWHRNVPHFARVKYRDVYPGIDLVYYGNQGQLESDYVLAPGTSPNQIGVRIEGTDKLKLNSQGDLVLSTKLGDVLLHKPRAYQQRAGSQQEVAANFIQRGPHTIGIEVASYDATQPLIIDPVLSYSTYLGGTANQLLTGIAADSSGFAYVTGTTTSADFPTVAGGLHTTITNPASNALITKLKQDGTGLVYSTFLGGTGTQGDGADAIAVDSAGDAYIVGSTSSSDFPVTPSAYQPFNKGGGGYFSKLDPTGSTLLYSTYLSGSGSDSLSAIALDTNNAAYITGSTTSTDFPIVLATAIQNSNNSTGSQGTAFLSKIDSAQSGTPSLVYSTYLGGTKQDLGRGVAVDSAFNAYIVGTTSSTDFPQPTVKNGFQQTLKNPSSNAFVARIDTTQPALLVYSTYLGGTPNGQGSSPGDVGTAIAVPPTGGIAYVTGYTYATDFPLFAPLYSTSNTPFQKAFIARVDTNKSGAASLPFSTYFGGTILSAGSTQPGAELAFGIALDSTGNAYVTGTTSSADFPVTPGAPQPTKVGRQNAFLSELNPTGSALLFSTYLGGSLEEALAVAVDGASPPNAYITGITSGNFPTTVGAFQTVDAVTGANNNDGFVAKLSPGAVTGVFASPAFLSFGNQIVNTPSSPKTVTLFNNSSSLLSNIAVSFAGANASDFKQGTSTCGTTLAASTTCTITVIFTPSTTSSETATLAITDSDSSSPQTVSLTGTGTAAPATVFLSPATVDFGNQTINTTSTPQSLTLNNNSAATVTGIAITIGGTSATSFAQTTTCGTTLAVAASCTISVTFTPKTASVASATLGVADSDASSPQTAVLTGTGISSTAPFSLAVTPTSATVAAGGTTTFAVTVTGLNGFASPVALTCSGAPLNSTCTLSPASVTPSASGTTSNATVVTKARSIVVPPPGSFRMSPRYPAVWPVVLLLALLAAWLGQRQGTRRLIWRISLCSMLVLAGCSGLRVPGNPAGTPAGTYTLTITGTSGAQSQQVTVSLTVT